MITVIRAPLRLSAKPNGLVLTDPGLEHRNTRRALARLILALLLQTDAGGTSGLVGAAFLLLWLVQATGATGSCWTYDSTFSAGQARVSTAGLVHDWHVYGRGRMKAYRLRVAADASAMIGQVSEPREDGCATYLCQNSGGCPPCREGFRFRSRCAGARRPCHRLTGRCRWRCRARRLSRLWTLSWM